MNIIHCLAWYFPFSTGGTESYVSALARSQLASGHKVKIIVPNNTSVKFPYFFDGVEVESYNVPHGSCAQFCLESDFLLHHLRDFCSRLDGYDIFHQHTLTPDTSIAHLSAAKSLGLKTIFTAHVPGVLCMRGTMLEYGISPCNGFISELRCGSCWAHSRGASISIAKPLVSLGIPLRKMPLFQRYPYLRRLSTLLRAGQHVNSHVQQLRDLDLFADHIVAVCKWLYDGFVSNNVSPSKLTLSRQGLQPEVIKKLRNIPGRTKTSISSSGLNKQITFGFIGRWDVVKGIDVAVRAFVALPADMNANLVIAAAGVSAENKKVRDDVFQIVGDDDRVSFREDITPDRIADFYGSIDVLLVPSKVMETGPMVVLEAIAAGLPVIGSSIGGIRELAGLYNGIHLANPFVIDSWTSLMAKIAVVPSMRISDSFPVRSSEHVARDMLAIYES